MLVASKTLKSTTSFVEFIIRALFPYAQDMLDVPYVKEVKPGQFFCYEHQFDICVVELNGKWGFKLGWHDYPDVCEKKERAFCTLHPVFTYQNVS